MKKNVIGLSTLLLVLLLSLSTTCYARQQPVTTDNVNELFSYYNSGWYNNANVNTLRNNVNNSLNTYQDIYDNCIFFVYNLRNGTHSMYIFYFNNSNTTLNYYNNYTSWQINSTEIKRFAVIDNNYSTITSVTMNANNDRGQYFMIRNDLGSLTAPFQSKNIMTFIDPHQEINFDMTSYSSTQYVDLTFIGDDGLTYNYQDIPIYYKPNDTSEIYIGTFNNPELTTLTNDNYAIIYYKNGTWYAKGIQSRNLDLYVNSSPYLSITPNNNLLEYEYGQKSRFSTRDCFYFYSIDNNINERAVALWYIGSNHTIVSGDRIDPTTFNNYDDYNDNLNNVLNNIDNIDNITAGTEPILETLTDDEQVSGELSGLISGDSSDIASRFGYSPVENPFTTVILDVMTDMTDILLGSGDQTLNFGFGGRDIIIHSSDFVLPTNRITTFLHLLVNGFFIWGIYKYGFTLYQWINSGRLQNLVNEANRHQYYLF